MNTDKDEAMDHQPYHTWMHELLDGALAVQARAQLETHLAGCLACQARWASLSAVDRHIKAAPMAAPRSRFARRFKARQAQRRARPRLVWGAVALGAGAVGMSGVVAVFGLALIGSLVRVAQQPATLLALNASAGATSDFVTTVADALVIAGRALLEGALDQPLAWAGAALALALTGVWLIVLRRLAPQGSVR